MKLVAVVVIALAASGIARADAPEPTVMVGLGAGFPGVQFGAEWFAEASVLPHPSSPVRVHAMFARGQADGEDYPSSMLYYNVRAGIERRACYPSGAFCFVFDGDVGMMHFWGYDWQSSQKAYPSDPDRNGLLVGGRVGFDTGGDHARFRLVLDVADAVTGQFVVHDFAGSARDMGTEVALQAELMVAL